MPTASSGSVSTSSSRSSATTSPSSSPSAPRSSPTTTRNWRNDENKPFTSDLSGQDFWTLIQAGYAPLGMVMGSCVYHIAHQGALKAMGNVGRNVEIPKFTEALYDARELAMSRMQAEAEALKAEGIVGVQLLSLAHKLGRPHD